MFTSSADVFRIRQIVSDLTTYIATEGRNALIRVSSCKSGYSQLCRILDAGRGRFSLPDDREAYGDVLLAAALPDDDFPAFTCATAFLLLDRIQKGGGDDNLFWNWDAFSEHYRLSDPAIRALLMNGFRTAARAGLVSVSSLPDPADCYTQSPDEIVSMLRDQRHEKLIRVIEYGTTPTNAADIWNEFAVENPSRAVLAGVRHLYERPQSLEPRDPELVSLIPWSL